MSREDAIATDLRVDPDQTPLAPRERAIVDYALKLTRTPWLMKPSDVEALKAEGLDELGVLHVVAVTSWFNYINRMADGLGITLDADTWEAMSRHAPIPWEAESASSRPPDQGTPHPAN